MKSLEEKLSPSSMKDDVLFRMSTNIEEYYSDTPSFRISPMPT
jgi:hypothetical protein